MGRSVALALLFAGYVTSAPASAQSFDALGTRAAGMGGAFVAVADDATGVYWNPAGLVLGGSYFGLVLDNNRGDAQPEGLSRAGHQSASIIALTALPVGLSYYTLTGATVRPTTDPGAVRLDRLTTHHAGLTLVQSITGRLAVGTTLRWVRGRAATARVPDGDRDDLLDSAGDLPGASTSRFDADIGVMASAGKVRAGLTVRNVTEPDFSMANGESVTLKRQTRAGIAYVGVPGVIVAADFDLERAAGALGEIRDVAAGAEAKIFKRVTVRSGVHFNTLGAEPGGHAPVYSIGGSVATFRSLLIDAQVTVGSRAGDRGWGIAARLGY
jgi:F plasmid transfer operon, TraF, protein